eukprot:scpid95988/ scgid0240/ 
MSAGVPFPCRVGVRVCACGCAWVCVCMCPCLCRPPFNNLKGVTHAFIEVSKAPAGSIDYPKLKEASIHCCRPEFIAEYLIQDPAPDVEKYYLSDVYSKRQSA